MGPEQLERKQQNQQLQKQEGHRQLLL